MKGFIFSTIFPAVKPHLLWGAKKQAIIAYPTRWRKPGDLQNSQRSPHQHRLKEKNVTILCHVAAEILKLKW
jgi:hypothetical protein